MLLLRRKKLQIRTRNDIKISSLPHPDDSAWAFLYRTGDDCSFINIIGIRKQTFLHIAFYFAQHFKWKFCTAKGGRSSKLSTEQCLGLLLQFYASTSELKQLSQIHGVLKAYAGKTIQRAEKALHRALRDIRDARIAWPSKATQIEWAQRITAKYPLITNRFGFVDGKNFHVMEPSNVDTQNAMYNGWLHSVLVTGVICVGVDGCIIWAKHNCVGSWNDGDMSRELQEKLLDPNYVDGNFGLVADTAFPVGKRLIGRIISPLKEGELERAHPLAQPALILLSSQITSLRQACEWGVGSIEKAYRQLLQKLPYNPEVRKIRIDNIFRLWNIRVRTTGISEVLNTFLN
jgi:hypothetical protein